MTKHESNRRPCAVQIVVKLGGSTFRERLVLDAIAAPLSDAALRHSILVLPGGGAFADAVRTADREFGLSDDASHWMAVRAMDQVAWLLAERIPRASVVTSLEEIGPVVANGGLPVLAPLRYLSDVDPLPHSWDVTSDSIAAWLAGILGARRVVLVKPAGIGPASSRDGRPVGVDGFFNRALPVDVDWAIVPADDPRALRAALTDFESGPQGV